MAGHGADDTAVALPKSMAWRLLDVMDARRGKVIPPRSMRKFVGAGDFEAVGRAFLGHCVDLASLRPTDRVLDVGCGIGRLAVPLSGYLASSATYHGVDTWPEGVAWCTRHIGAAFPAFTFELLDVFDEKYNPLSRATDEAIAIEAPAGSFDVATLISILHLHPVRVRRYLDEIGRLLRPGGRYLGTWYLLSEDDRRPPDTLPPAAVSEGTARTMLAEAGLEVTAVHYGQWDGRADGLSYQDIVVGRRTGDSGRNDGRAPGDTA
jgi:SAM-dependent methyltransferase